MRSDRPKNIRRIAAIILEGSLDDSFEVGFSSSEEACEMRAAFEELNCQVQLHGTKPLLIVCKKEDRI